MRNVLPLVLFYFLSSIVTADYKGSYEYSKNEYSKLTELLNKNNSAGDYSLVNIEMPNNGVFSLGMSNGQELMLVNHITFNMSAINYGSALVSRSGNEFEYSNIELPILYKIEHEGATYSLRKPVSKVKNGDLIVSYMFTCMYPATFVTAGDCSDHKVYQAKLKYKLKEGRFVLVETDIKI